MIQDIVSIRLPVDETYHIQKNSISHGSGKRICVVTGIHGDELEGQYVCFLLAQKLLSQIEKLHGTVDIYPAANPLGIDSINRGLPGFDLDMNRTFPGSDTGDMVEFTAMKLVEDLKGADLVFDIHASNIYLTEIPQIRINEKNADQLVPLARLSNVDLIWVHGNSTVLESTLAYSLNSRGTPCLVAEMGVGMRLTEKYGRQFCDGIFSLMQHLDMWDGDVPPVREPLICDDPDEVVFLNAPTSGMFMKTKEHGSWVGKGETVGYIFDPLRGEIREYINADKSGLLFTIREYPLVAEGSLMGRILAREANR
ncbi:MAG: M14 family metallopeptidase [Lachnospiraceae bacterium]|nr:M14 family metallopeptidase [Lachnospiraceae bacterium]